MTNDDGSESKEPRVRPRRTAVKRVQRRALPSASEEPGQHEPEPDYAAKRSSTVRLLTITRFPIDFVRKLSERKIATGVLSYWLYFERNVLNWRYLRLLGELQILTRASYLLLIAVPIVAGLWPPIEYAVDQYNDRSAEIYQGLEGASENALEVLANIGDALALADGVSDSESTLLAIEDSRRTLYEIERRITSVTDQFRPTKLRIGGLPHLFALSFLASLLVVFAQLIYQLVAPGRIKESGYLEYVNERTESLLRSLTLARRHELEQQVTLAVNAGIYWEEIRDGREVLPKLSPMASTRDDDELRLLQAAAAWEYAEDGILYPYSRVIVASMFVVAILVLVYILIDRTNVILATTNWPW